MSAAGLGPPDQSTEVAFPYSDINFSCRIWILWKSLYMPVLNSVFHRYKFYWKFTYHMKCTDIVNLFTASSMKTSPSNSFSSLPWNSTPIPHSKTKFRSCSKVLSRKSKWKNPCFCVPTSLYSEGQRKGSNLCLQPQVSGAESIQSYRSTGKWLKGTCTVQGRTV